MDLPLSASQTQSKLNHINNFMKMNFSSFSETPTRESTLDLVVGYTENYLRPKKNLSFCESCTKTKTESLREFFNWQFIWS